MGREMGTRQGIAGPLTLALSPLSRGEGIRALARGEGTGG